MNDQFAQITTSFGLSFLSIEFILKWTNFKLLLGLKFWLYFFFGFILS